jgi:hypothetical protein
MNECDECKYEWLKFAAPAETGCRLTLPDVAYDPSRGQSSVFAVSSSCKTLSPTHDSPRATSIFGDSTMGVLQVASACSVISKNL